MADHSPKRPEHEIRPASHSVADMGTQTEEEETSERQRTSLARARSSARDKQISRRGSVREAKIVTTSKERSEPAHHDHDREGVPALRLDMDLDVDIKLQAKIKGDLELSILDSEQASRQLKSRRPSSA
ncbi:hypothetical protein N657DRAFT_683793 [Parathielavia appendiculata]|uniref:Uncharacterized protein n=1 Tax=Parathielavia appendiculata TaxID=2587402 RepID=A0AAN6TTL4_9PEZI|nr:hypothetical protein N657DRAFT_683793 [Parathielavia appendiculata]